MEERKLAEPLPSNRYSDVSRKRQPTRPQETPELKPVVKGRVRERKKSLGEKFTETFLASDARNVRDYVIFEKLIPAVKRTVFDVFDGSLRMFLFGEKAGPTRERSYNPYNRYYDDRPPWRGSGSSRMEIERRRPTTPLQVTQLEFEEWEDAEEVLKGLEARIQECQVATVRDLYRLMDWEADYTKDPYGWYSVADATIHQYRDCWLLTLPKPVLI